MQVGCWVDEHNVCDLLGKSCYIRFQLCSHDQSSLECSTNCVVFSQQHTRLADVLESRPGINGSWAASIAGPATQSDATRFVGSIATSNDTSC